MIFFGKDSSWSKVKIGCLVDRIYEPRSLAIIFYSHFHEPIVALFLITDFIFQFMKWLETVELLSCWVVWYGINDII